MDKVRILTNYFGGVLWDINLWGNHKASIRESSKDYYSSLAIEPSNLYYTTGEVDNKESPSTLKTEKIDTTIRKASIIEVIGIKYLFPLLFMYFFIYINTYYPSMVGLCIASFIYLAFYQIKRRISIAVSYLFLFLLMIAYATFMFSDLILAAQLNMASILNYVIQYFFWIWVTEKIFIDIYSRQFIGLYSIGGLFLTYMRIVDDESEAAYKKRLGLGRKFFTVFLVLVFCFTFLLGVVDMAREYEIKKQADIKSYENVKSDIAVLKSKKYEVLKNRLDKQAIEVGMNLHSGERSLALMKSDFDEYLRRGVVSYEKIKVTRTNKILRLKDKKYISSGSFKKPFYIFSSYVKMYEDGEYRWHFYINGDVHVVMNSPAINK